MEAEPEKKDLEFDVRNFSLVSLFVFVSVCCATLRPSRVSTTWSRDRSSSASSASRAPPPRTPAPSRRSRIFFCFFSFRCFAVRVDWIVDVSLVFVSFSSWSSVRAKSTTTCARPATSVVWRRTWPSSASSRSSTFCFIFSSFSFLFFFPTHEWRSKWQKKTIERPMMRSGITR